MSDVIFPTGIPNGTPATDDRIMFSDTSASNATKDCAISELPVSDATSAAIAVVQSDINTHEARTDNPHSVTKSQVGLGNVDNTSDANKPVSTATQTALDGKQNTLTAGTNITIIGDTINAIGGGSGSGSNTPFFADYFTATLGQTVFPLSFTYDQTKGSALVIKEGVQLRPTTDFTEDGSSITLTLPADLNAKVTVMLLNKGLNWKGAYNGATSYLVDDAVSYNGSSYISIQNTTGNLPTNATYWDLLASKGDAGAGSSVTPASTVTDETTYGIAPAVGTGTDYARNDHTHGTPPTPTKSTVGLGNVDNTSDATKDSATTTLSNKTLTNTDRIEMDTSPTSVANTEGVMIWNSTDKCLDIYDGTTKLQTGQEMHVIAHNDTGSTILNGKAVYITGASGTRPTIALAKGDVQATSDTTLGITTSNILNGAEGKITISGLINNIDTSAIASGSAIYLSDTTAGEFTTTQPQAPSYVVHMGHVIVSNATTGSILSDPYVVTQMADSVRIEAGAGISEMNNVQDFFRHSWSSGITEGCTITDNADGTVNIASGEILIRETNADDAVLTPLVVPSQTNITCTASDISYLYVDYNGGSPTWQVGTALTDFDGITKVIGYQIARNGTSLNILDLRKINIDFGRKQRRANAEWDGFAFKGLFRSILGVSAFSSSGLNVLVGAGKYFYFNNPFTHTAFDTTVAGAAVANNFVRFYNRSSWQQTTGLKSVNNTDYDFAGTLTTFGGGGNRFRTDWWFVVMGDTAPYLAQIFGNVEYTSLSSAQADPFPTLPPHIDGNAVLIGQSVVQKSVASLTILKAGSSEFSGSASSSDHATLTNLSWTGSGHTDGVNSIAGFNGSGAAAAYTLSGTGTELPTTAGPTFSKLGVGVAPAGWGSLNKVIDLNTAGAIGTADDTTAFFNRNGYYDGTNWKYKTTSYLQHLALTSDGKVQFYTAPSGTAGNNATLTKVLEIGNLGNVALTPYTTATGGFSTTIANSTSAPTNAWNYSVLGNTQSVAHVMNLTDTGTSAQANIAYRAKVYNASSGAIGFDIDPSTTCTGVGINFANTGGNGFAGIYYSSIIAGGAGVTRYGIRQLTIVQNDGIGYGLHQNVIAQGTFGTGYGIYQGTIGSCASGTGYGLYQNSITDGDGPGYGIYQNSIAGGAANAWGWYVANIGSSATNGNTGKYFSLNNAQSGSLQARTNNAAEMLFSRTNTGATTITDNFNCINIKRTSISNNASSNYTAQGSILKLENVATQTAGTLTDSVSVLSLVQDNDSTGGHILFNSYSGTPTTDGILYFNGSDLKMRIGGVTYTFTKT